MSKTECWTCGNEFENKETSRVDCDGCKSKRYERKAMRAIGRRGEVCYQGIPGHWSPHFVDGKALSALGGGYLNVLCDDGVCRKVHVGSFGVYLADQSTDNKQLSLF